MGATGEVASYLLSSADRVPEERRLAALSENFDPVSQSLMRSLGLTEGSSCLEVGVGNGSVGRWLSVAVGTTGRVICVDSDESALNGVRGPNVKRLLGDIRHVEVEPSSVDLIHMRLTLQHVPGPMEVLRKLGEILRPGGWLVVGEHDYTFSYRTHGIGALYQRMVDAAVEALRRRDGNPELARQLPAMFTAAGFTDVDGTGTFRLIAPNSPSTELLVSSVDVFRVAVPVPGVAAEDYETLKAEIAAGRAIEEGPVMLWCWGRRGV